MNIPQGPANLNSSAWEQIQIFKALWKADRVRANLILEDKMFWRASALTKESHFLGPTRWYSSNRWNLQNVFAAWSKEVGRNDQGELPGS